MFIIMALAIIALLIDKISNKTEQTSRILRVEPHTTDRLPCLSDHCIFAANEILKSIDISINPCEDFYAYACNQWINTNPIPEGKSTWGTFSKLEQINQLVIRNELEKPLKYFKSDAERKAKVYYESCLDKDEHMEKLGAKPLTDLLWKIGGWNVTESGFNITNWNLANVLKVLHNRYVKV
ncbi:neprilysin-3-like [Teleopsis dalmanni]|uniref:neprilysin-3-like n=1 Tax=Teleopsis dalmanni TaxID=139649 RepID=UPI0018CE22A3|nr:neprilysin-3-like [Teleopsis dalmanni]XP_037948977.1 neprilysin-3-like [Teleopsis dalmanni]